MNGLCAAAIERAASRGVGTAHGAGRQKVERRRRSPSGLPSSSPSETGCSLSSAHAARVSLQEPVFRVLVLPASEHAFLAQSLQVSELVRCVLRQGMRERCKARYNDEN